MHEYGIIRRLTGNRLSLEMGRVLDFGCGEGIAAASFALRHPTATVFGVDIAPPDLGNLGAKFAEQIGLDIPHNLFLLFSEPGTLPAEIHDMDLIFAWSVFEHVSFSQLAETMRLLKGRLRTGGLLVLQINPLYFSPKGSHLYRYDPTPWTHLLNEPDTLRAMVMNSRWPETTKVREWAQFETLNRVTADDIRDAALVAGLSVAFEERLPVTEVPPPRLTFAYNRDALVTQEIRLLLT